MLQPFSVEQDHRAVQRVTRPMLGFQSCHAAQRTLMGVTLLHLHPKLATKPDLAIGLFVNRYEFGRAV